MNNHLKQAILLVLRASAGVPMPETALVSAVQAYVKPDLPTTSDVLDALRDVEAGGYAIGVTDPFTAERSWTLTTRGVHQARALR